MATVDSWGEMTSQQVKGEIVGYIQMTYLAINTKMNHLKKDVYIFEIKMRVLTLFMALYQKVESPHHAQLV